MQNFEPNYNYSVQDFKDQTLFVRACRDVLASTVDQYQISYKEYQPVQAVLLSQSVFDALVANIDSSKSLAPYISPITLNSVAASVRFEEVFHLVTGDSEFPGTTPATVSMDHRKEYSGLEKKIVAEGSTERYVTETVTASGGQVQVSYPIGSTLSIAASFTGGNLDVSDTSGQQAALTIQDITYTSVVGAETANNISIQYLDATPAQAARLNLPDIQIVAAGTGTPGNDITFELTVGATLGSEIVTVTGSAISVQIADGQTSAALLANAIANDTGAMAVIQPPIVINPSNPQTALAATNLTGGAAAVGLAGAEVVTVSGNDITIQLESGVSTATQVLAAYNGAAAATALATAAISGTGSNVQTAPVGPLNLEGGQDLADMLQLGQVALSQNGTPVADSDSVEISYSTPEYVTYEIDIKTGTVVVASSALISYLTANAL
jgi:hypothetical protein